MPTLKQKRAVEEILENTRTGGTKGDALRKAGYSEEMAKQPSVILESEGFEEAAEPFVNKMVKLRDKIIKEMDIRKMDEVQFNDMTTAVDKLTKNIQLLSGGATERTELKLSAEREAEIRRALGDM